MRDYWALEWGWAAELATQIPSLDFSVDFFSNSSVFSTAPLSISIPSSFPPANKQCTAVQTTHEKLMFAYFSEKVSDRKTLLQPTFLAETTGRHVDIAGAGVRAFEFLKTRAAIERRCRVFPPLMHIQWYKITNYSQLLLYRTGVGTEILRPVI